MLPEGWAIRQSTAADADELLALVHVCDLAAVGFADFDLDDVAVGLEGPASVVAVGPTGKIMAWGYLDNSTQGPRDFLEVYAHPVDGLPAQRPLLDYLLERVKERGTYARAGAVPTEMAWTDSLEAAGFTFLKQYVRMQIDLPVELPPVEVDALIRPVRQDELLSFHRALEAAFADTPDFQSRTYEQWRSRFIDGHQVDWDEWLVAVVDGQFAGVLQSKTDGWVQNLAVLRDYRRRGIGRALLAAAFKVYADKGHRQAGLGVDLTNPTRAIKLYTDVGMTPAYQANVYEKP